MCIYPFCASFEGCLFVSPFFRMDYDKEKNFKKTAFFTWNVPIKVLKYNKSGTVPAVR